MKLLFCWGEIRQEKIRRPKNPRKGPTKLGTLFFLDGPKDRRTETDVKRIAALNEVCLPLIEVIYGDILIY